MNRSECITCLPMGKPGVPTRVVKILGAVDGWRLVSLATALGVLIPLVVLFLFLLTPEKEILVHMAETLLVELIANTAILAAGVLAGTFTVGVSLAWLTGVYEFPGRKTLSWALLLPLAMPTYVLAFVFIGWLDYAGPVQTVMRGWIPSSGKWFPDVRSAGGVIIVMTLALYPYVYMLTRNAFRTQGKRALEAAQSLGCGRLEAFFRVALPMARPWIAGGLMLVLMEVLADFGAVSIFNFDTFTTAIYKAWFGFFSLPAAAQLSTPLVVIAFAILLLEQKMRSNMRFTQSGRTGVETDRISLTGWRRQAATMYAGFMVLIAFVLPFSQLLIWSVRVFPAEYSPRYGAFLFHSLQLSFLAAFLVVAISLFLALTRRRHSDRWSNLLVRLSTLGYAMPGTVLAVGIFIAAGYFDNVLTSAVQLIFPMGKTHLLRGTIWVMVGAYAVRFLAAGFNAVNSAMHRVTPGMEEAAMGLGVTGIRLIGRIHVPLLKGGLITAAVLVFVDVMKEMPITLMTRPYGWDTLAVKIYELTSEGEWERAALASVVLVLAGLLPVVLITRHADAGSVS